MKPLNNIFVLIIIMCGCKPNISNDANTLDKVFLKEKIKIVIKSQGCFGGGNYFFTLKKEQNNYKLCYKKRELIVKPDSIKSFKKFLLSTFTSEQKKYCTTTHYIKVGNYFNSVDFEDITCSNYNGIFDIIPFETLILEEDNESYEK